MSKLRVYVDKLLRTLRLKPLSLAEKCRLQFGGAVLLVLTLALLIPYFWMDKLTEKIAQDSGRAVAFTIFDGHAAQAKPLPQPEIKNSDSKTILPAVRWLRFDKFEQAKLDQLSEREKKVIEQLMPEENRPDYAWTESLGGLAHNKYVKIMRAADNCIICHNPQGTALPFNKNQQVGALIIQTPAREIANTILMNRVFIIIAGLLAATGAMVAFYSIAQRIILRPIRQLRALVSNVAEGNLDTRSAIKSGDEYERLSDAFNDMLDGLQESQQKLRQANHQLDAKIAQLSDRNIELFKANKLKSEFLANMSHEFRTPLNSILGFAQLLREKPGANFEKSKRYAENIVSSGRSLLNMINDLLDLAKAEAGKMELRIEKTSVQKLCQSLVAFFSPMIEEKEIEVEVDADEDIPLIQTDPGKVQQILYNLLSNAVKFTPDQGRIKILAAMLDDNTVRISITDTGSGISEEHKDRIFEKFRQLDGSITRKSEGTGLGLAICKELADLLAGDISVESELGKGSTFCLDIPLVLPDASEPKDNQ